MEPAVGDLTLERALRIGPAESVAFVGAGGKTSAMFHLARQLPPPVLVTTSTHLAKFQLELADRHIQIREPEDIEVLENLEFPPVTLITGTQMGTDRVGGVAPGILEKLIGLAKGKSIPILIEADGSRLRPLKAPDRHEPVIPTTIDVVIVVAGLSGLGNPLDEEWVHRPRVFAGLSGAGPGELISATHLSKVLLHEDGGLKDIPSDVRRIVLLNQAVTEDLRSQAHQIAVRLLPTYSAVLVCALGEPGTAKEKASANEHEAAANQDPHVYAVHERVAGIILAAGRSSRIGTPKQLLDWHGVPLVRHVAKSALDAGLSPVVLVTGAFGEQVRHSVNDMPLEVIDNPDWETGQASSVRAGLNALPKSVGGAVFLLADQPQIPPLLIRALIEKHAETLSPILAPRIEGQRGNPVLFDRSTFQDLFKIRGDTGGRAIFSRYPLEWIEWSDAAVLLDVDTIEDYERLMNLTP